MISTAKIPHTERLERVARAMCAAKGHNPDEVVSGSPSDFVFPQHNGQTGIAADWSGARWETFAREAAVFLAALDAA